MARKHSRPTARAAPDRPAGQEKALTPPKIQTDFMGFLAADLLCLAHCEAPLDHAGSPVELSAGMYVIAFDEDVNADGEPEFLVVSGSVESSPPEVQHRGSIWSLRVDSRGVRHLSSLDDAD
ncbi:MAG: hypothetical protein ACYTBS_17215 [Planctomycetota bacterium]